MVHNDEVLIKYHKIKLKSIKSDIDIREYKNGDGVELEGLEDLYKTQIQDIYFT